MGDNLKSGMPAAMLIPAPTTTHMFLSVDMINVVVNICDLEEHLILQYVLGCKGMVHTLLLQHVLQKLMCILLCFEFEFVIGTILYMRVRR